MAPPVFFKEGSNDDAQKNHKSDLAHHAAEAVSDGFQDKLGRHPGEQTVKNSADEQGKKRMNVETDDGNYDDGQDEQNKKQNDHRFIDGVKGSGIFYRQFRTKRKYNDFFLAYIG